MEFLLGEVMEGQAWLSLTHAMTLYEKRSAALVRGRNSGPEFIASARQPFRIGGMVGNGMDAWRHSRDSRMTSISKSK